MRQITVYFALMLASGLLCFAALRGYVTMYPPNSVGHAKAEIAQVHPIKYVASTDWTTASLVVQNSGRRRLTVRVKDEDCGTCTFRSKTVRIEPGESKNVEFSFATALLWNQTGLSVIIATNDPDQGSIPVTFEIRGENQSKSAAGATSVLESQPGL